MHLLRSIALTVMFCNIISGDNGNNGINECAYGNSVALQTPLSIVIIESIHRRLCAVSFHGGKYH